MFLTSKTEPPLQEAGARTSPPDAGRETGRRKSEEEREEDLRKMVTDAARVATEGIEKEDEPAETAIKLDKQITPALNGEANLLTFI
jgi:predicted hydrocarbon binding protein